MRHPLRVAVLAALLTATGCAERPDAPQAPAPSAVGPSASVATERVEGTIVRFQRDDASVDVTIGADTPTTRDLLSMLPLTLTLEEFNGKEKIGYPPRRLATAGTPGSDPEDGDLIYYTPWGNLGFYYDASGVGHTERTPHIGTFTAMRDELGRLEGGPVRVSVVE